MGQKPDDIADEIARLRAETDTIVDELLRRASLPNLAKGMTSTMAGRASSIVSGAASGVSFATASIPEPVRQHPLASTFTAVGLLSTLLSFAVSSVALGRERTASERAAEQLRESRDRISESLGRLYRA